MMCIMVTTELQQNDNTRNKKIALRIGMMDLRSFMFDQYSEIYV